jgi:tetratricopeptide (TPR) repeat protein
VLAVLAIASLALAANPKATQLAKDGDRLYKEGKYREAADALKQAYELEKSPVLLFNIARAYDQAGDLQIALDTYREYIALPETDPQLVKRANLAMDRLRSLVAKGQADKQVQDAESKRLKDEAEAAKQKAQEEADNARRQREEFERKEAARKAEANKGLGARKLIAIVFGVLAVGGAGTGAAMGYLATSSKQQFTSALTLAEKKATEESTKQFALIADVCFAAALVTAVVFAVVFPWSSLGGDSQGSVQVAFSPSGLALGGTF